jgi:hypothetical protein
MIFEGSLEYIADEVRAVVPAGELFSVFSSDLQLPFENRAQSAMDEVRSIIGMNLGPFHRDDDRVVVTYDEAYKEVWVRGQLQFAMSCAISHVAAAAYVCVQDLDVPSAA